jgi:hypothetical protein
VAISSQAQTYNQWTPDVTNDSYGRSIVTWFDTNGVYAQRIDLSGNKLWTTDGVVVSTGVASPSIDGPDYWPAIILDDLGYGAMIAWTDYRNGAANTDVYAEKIQSNGTLACADYPVMNGQTTVHYPTIQAAYNAAGDQTIQMESIEFTEDLILSGTKSVALQGGYYGCDYSTLNGFTTTHGTMTIGGGTVTVASLIIQ